VRSRRDFGCVYYRRGRNLFPFSLKKKEVGVAHSESDRACADGVLAVVHGNSDSLSLLNQLPFLFYN
jgi:hypothetical protein